MTQELTDERADTFAKRKGHQHESNSERSESEESPRDRP